MTTVVNINNEKCDVYCGRGSIWGNPFKITEIDNRGFVIERYSEWFNILLKDKFFVKELEKLRGKKLGCYCVPQACHCNIIANYLNSTEPQDIKKRVGVIGSRDWPDKDFVFNILTKNKHKISCIVSGGANGVDSYAVEWAIKHGMNYSVWPAAWHDPETGIYNPKAGFVRNHYIVNDSDIILAFRFNNSSGTSHTIEITKKIGKPIKIFER